MKGFPRSDVKLQAFRSGQWENGWLDTEHFQ